MHVFAGDSAEIVPGTAQCRGDPGGILVGERGTQIGAANPMGGSQRAQSPRHRATPVGRTVGIACGAAPPACT